MDPDAKYAFQAHLTQIFVHIVAESSKSSENNVPNQQKMLGKPFRKFKAVTKIICKYSYLNL